MSHFTHKHTPVEVYSGLEHLCQSNEHIWRSGTVERSVCEYHEHERF